MLVATRYFPTQLRGKVLGFIASTVAFGSGIGPIVGGFIAGTWHWRYLFLISLLTLFTIFFFNKWLPDEEKRSSNLDIKGAFLMGIAIATLLFALNQLIWWLVPLSILLFILFVLHILRTENPFLRPDLFLNIPFRNGLITGFLTVGTVFGMMFMVPIMLKQVHQLHTSHIGLVMFPGAMSAAVMGAIGGKLADKKGSIPIVYTGLCLLFCGFFLFSTFAGHTPVVIALILIILLHWFFFYPIGFS